MPLSEWTRLYSETMQNPMDHDLCASCDFFDRSVLSGESSILDSLEKHIQHEMQDRATAIALLTNDTLNRTTLMLPSSYANTWTPEAPVETVRFVVLDTETTGTDPRRDKIITIGALAVCGGEILLEESFEVMLRLAYNNSSVTVHGITFDEARGGMEESVALE